MQKLLKNQKEEEFNKNKLKVLAELTRIRQICCDPSLCFENYNGGSAKREACMELITSASESGHKMLVFSQFTSMLELLENDLKEDGISWYKITGSTPKEERLRLVKAFNEDNVPVVPLPPRYTVQTGAFRNPLYAERLRRELSELDFPASVVEGNGLYRVMVGVFPHTSRCGRNRTSAAKRRLSNSHRQPINKTKTYPNDPTRFLICVFFY